MHTRSLTIATLFTFSVWHLAFAGDANQIRNGEFSSENLREWKAAERAKLERLKAAPEIDRPALKVTWNDTSAFINQWGRAGNLAQTTGSILTSPLLRDTRYRLSCRVLVEKLELTEDSRKWYAALPPGQYDPPTITLGCRAGYWNSGMPWLAYNMSEAGTWQELSCEFTTPYASAGGFLLTLNVYPSQQARVRSSGTLYLTDVRLERCEPLQVGITRTRKPIVIDGRLEDWWETNPVVVTSDQVRHGQKTRNRDACALFYTMWDDSYLYIAAKVIDDHVTNKDGVAVYLNKRKYFVANGSRPNRFPSQVRSVPQLGSATNMYRIASQYGESIRRHGGYIAELAIPLNDFTGTSQSARDNRPHEIAFEIYDADQDEDQTRVLRYPGPPPSAMPREASFAQIVWADHQGRRGGGGQTTPLPDRPQYAVTDAGNDRSHPRTLAIKNVASHVLRQGRSGYPLTPYRGHDRSSVDAVISWTTSLPAQAHLEFGFDASYGQRAAATNSVGDSSGKAMRVLLRGLRPNAVYHFRVVAHATDAKQVIASDDFILDTRAVGAMPGRRGRVPLTIDSDSRVDRKASPVTSGVPFPQGHLFDTKHLQLVDQSDEPIPAQFAPLAEWPDGSIQWVLVDFQTDLAAGASKTFHLLYGPDVESQLIESPLLVDEDDNSIRIDTGRMQLVLSKTKANVIDELHVGERLVAGNGRAVMLDGKGREFIAGRPDVVEIEDSGPLRVTVRVAGRYQHGAASLFDYEFRIHCYRGSSRLRITHNYTVYPERRSDPAANRFRPAPPTPVSIRAMWIELPLYVRAQESVRCGTSAESSISFPLSAEHARLDIAQQRESEASIGKSKYRRLPGWLTIGPVTTAVRHFWQLYPKRLSVERAYGRTTLRIDTHPPLDETEYAATDGSIEEFVWGYLRDGRYRLRRGEGRRHEVWFDFDTQPDDRDYVGRSMLAEPLFAAADPKWYGESGALGPLAPRSPRSAAYDQRFSESLQALLETRDSEPFFRNRFGRYGLRNFGDNFGSDGLNWDNVEYDLGHSLLAQFMRTGDRDALRVGREILEHNMDVDCVTIREGFEYLCHHTGDHNVKLAGIGHTWCEGLWEYYFLTGDRRAARKALGIANRLARETVSLTAAGKPGAGGSRDFGWSVIGLLASYRATADPLYLNAAREIKEVVVRTQHPFRGGWLERLSVGHCYHAPAHIGRVYFMQDIVLNGLVAFHQLTGDPDVRQCLENTVRGMLDDYENQRASGLPGWGYTSCPFMLRDGPIQHIDRVDRKHSFGALRNYVSIYYFASLARHADLAMRAERLLNISKTRLSGKLPIQGKMFAQATRWVPQLLHYLAQLDRPTARRKPNVLLIMTDDQGYGDLHLHGNDQIDTPTLDQLARDSTRFDRFFVSPLCSFTRASLMTGRYYLRTGCASVTRGIETVRSNETTIAEMLKQAGYATGCFGKWHIGEHYPNHPKGQGFDEFLGMPQGHWDNYFDPVLERDGRMVQTKGYITDVLTSAAIDFIRRKQDQPFFCYVPYNAPHTPMQLSDHLFDKYKSRGLDNRNAAIYGMIENIDGNVARLLQALDELNLADDTIVIFLSDNGAEGPQGSRFNAGMRGMKGSVHEGGMRVPCFVRWPNKIASNRVVEQIAAHIDLLPTIAELCGVPATTSQPVDGISLAPVLIARSPPNPTERMIFHRSPGWKRLVAYEAPVIDDLHPYAGAVRTQRWRAVKEGADWELYDMQADPSQKLDVAAKFPHIAKRLGKAYDEWFRDVTRQPIVRPRIEVGHHDWPVEKLTIPEAYFTGSIRWYNKWGFAHDWLTDWKETRDTIWWEVDVVEAGTFAVKVVYACDEDAVGTVLQVESGEATTFGPIQKAHPPRPKLRPTRSAKVRYIQTFSQLRLGEITLPKGKSRITLRALESKGRQIADIHSIILQRLR